MSTTQPATAVLMVRPTSFGFDEQTAQTNTFQHKITSESRDAVRRQAEAEFDAYVEILRFHDIQVVIFEDSPTPPKPNAVFPNNWLTTWPDGTAYLYPMATESRRMERNLAVFDQLRQDFKISAVRDISSVERTGKHLEGTGAMVFDHANKVVYGCISPRCDKELFIQHAQSLGYRPIAFHAYENNVPIYHTNVMMSVQAHTAVVCSESIADEAERRLVLDTLRSTDHKIVEISYDQMNHFCGNVIELWSRASERFLVLSEAAYKAFTPEQRAVLGHDMKLLPVSVPTIEEVGGGSARCMVAEIFLPAKTN